MSFYWFRIQIIIDLEFKKCFLKEFYLIKKLKIYRVYQWRGLE